MLKNFGFLMSHDSNWDISPVFDLTYAHNTAFGAWTRSQQMSVNGKREDITTDEKAPMHMAPGLPPII